MQKESLLFFSFPSARSSLSKAKNFGEAKVKKKRLTLRTLLGVLTQKARKCNQDGSATLPVHPSKTIYIYGFWMDGLDKGCSGREVL